MNLNGQKKDIIKWKIKLNILIKSFSEQTTEITTNMLSAIINDDHSETERLDKLLIYKMNEFNEMSSIKL